LLISTNVVDRVVSGMSAVASSCAALWPAFAIALIVGGAAAALGHGGGEHEPPLSASPSTDFGTPAPGTYDLPPLGVAADGAVVGSDGRPVRLYELYGPDVVLLSFVYTRCSDADGCPLATAVLHAVGGLLAQEPDVVPRLRLVSLSFDPVRDTPEVMTAYGESFRRDGLDWRFLTTESEDALAPLLSAYRQTRVRELDDAGEETGQYAHLLRVFLIDGQRIIRQVYSTSLLDPKALVADVKTILLEAAAVGASASSPASAASSSQIAASTARRSGDDRSAYSTQSLALAARRGQPADLLARVSKPPLGLPPVPVTAGNPITREKIALGRRLFFERRLSRNDTLSCAMCHVPEQGFTSNEMATAVGIEGRSVRRNAPTLYNVAYLRHLFHDGRVTNLGQQVWGPLLASNEMGNPSISAVLSKVRQIDAYEAEFERAFPGRGLSMSTLGEALASYQRTLVSGDSSFDRFLYGGDAEALSAAAQRGFALFSGRAGCSGCHTVARDHALFTDDAFHNTGVGFHAAMGEGEGNRSGETQRVQVAPGVHVDVPRAIVAKVSESPANDLGRYEVTRDRVDRWRYRTPSLRNIALSAPYMHDGSLATLRDVVDFYRRGGVANEGLDPRVRPIELSESEADELVAFLESLTGNDIETLVDDAYAAPIGDRDR
jgi:cytochrome c peroxidase